MSNKGPHANGSQFFICRAACPWHDGKHVVFGNVTAGMDVLKAMGYVGSTKCKGKPLAKVMIVNCGQLGVLKPFVDQVLGSVTNNNRKVVSSIKAAVTSNTGKSMTKQVIVADSGQPFSQRLYPAVDDNNKVHLPGGRIAKSKPWYLCCINRWSLSDSESKGNLDGSDYVKLLD